MAVGDVGVPGTCAHKQIACVRLQTTTRANLITCQMCLAPMFLATVMRSICRWRARRPRRQGSDSVQFSWEIAIAWVSSNHLTSDPWASSARQEHGPLHHCDCCSVCKNERPRERDTRWRLVDSRVKASGSDALRMALERTHYVVFRNKTLAFAIPASSFSPTSAKPE